MPKKSLRRMLRAAAAALVATSAGTGLAHAQKPSGLPGNYPSKPIRVIVGTAPGGGLDNVTRPVMLKLSERWGTPSIIENKVSGIGSVVAMEYTARAAPDGYTLMIGSSSTFLNAARMCVPASCAPLP